MNIDTAMPPTIKETLNLQGKHQTPQTLRDSVEFALENYFAQLEGQNVTNVYNMVLAEVEIPLFEAAMRYCNDNQTKASELLGINRGTLRKKLLEYGLLNSTNPHLNHF